MRLQTPMTRERGVTFDTNSLPDKDRLARLLAAIARPFVLSSDRELSVLRRGLTKEGWKRSLYLQDAPDDPVCLTGAGLLARANQWLIKDITIPPRSGCCHDFFCDDGNRLEIPKSLAPQSQYVCPVCRQTYSGEKYDAAVRWYQHYAMSMACLALALMYQIDRDAEYANKAIEILLKYAQAYPGPHTDTVEGGIIHRSIDEAVWVVPLAQSYDLIYHTKSLTPADRDLIENNFFRSLAQGLLDLDSNGSWGVWHGAAAGVIGCVLKDADILSESIKRFSTQIALELGDDGIWPESPHTNHFFTLMAFIQLAEACNRLGIDLYNYQPKRGKSLKSMFVAPISLMYPSLQLPAINDGCYNAFLPLSLYEVAYRRWSDPSFAWVLKTGYGYARNPICNIHEDYRNQFTRSSLYGFLFGRDLPGRTQEPQADSSAFDSLGICVLRNNDGTALTLDYGHKFEQGHLDKLAITLYSNNGVLCADYGAPGSGAKVFDYYKETVSHNTVIVDGKNQQPSDKSELVQFKPGDYLQLAEAQSTDSYPGVIHKRLVLLAWDVALVQDELESESKHVYDWLLRCEGQLCDCPDDKKSVEGLPDLFTEPRLLGEGREFSVRWHVDNYGLGVWLGVDSQAALISALCPAETAVRTIPVVDLRQNSASARYHTLLAPYCDAVPQFERQGKVLKVTRGNVTDWIYSSDAPFDAVESAEIDSDASFAAVREVDGAVAACGLFGGSYINLRSEFLLQGCGPFEKIEAKLDSRNPVISFKGSPGGCLKLKCHSRAMRVNGHKISATSLNGVATIKLVGVLAEV